MRTSAPSLTKVSLLRKAVLENNALSRYSEHLKGCKIRIDLPPCYAKLTKPLHDVIKQIGGICVAPSADFADYTITARDDHYFWIIKDASENLNLNKSQEQFQTIAIGDATGQCSTLRDCFDWYELPELTFPDIRGTKKRVYNSPFERIAKYSLPKRIYSPSTSTYSKDLQPRKGGYCEICDSTFSDPEEHRCSFSHTKCKGKISWKQVDRAINALNSMGF